MRRNNKGLSLPEVLIMAAIIGGLALMAPAVVNMLNSLKYQQEIAQVNTETRALLRQIMHEIRNAAEVRVMQNFDPNRNYPAITECLAIKTYELQKYKHPVRKTYENTDMFQKFIPGTGGLAFNWRMNYYCIYDESMSNASWDFNRNGTDRYLLKASIVPRIPWSFNPNPATTYTSDVSAVWQMVDSISNHGEFDPWLNMQIPTFAGMHDFERRVFLRNKVKLSSLGSEVFTEVNGETYKIELPVYPPFLKPGSAPRTYVGMATMRGKNVFN